MNILRVIIALILAVKLSPINDEDNKQIVNLIGRSPEVIESLIWDSLSTPTWIYLAILVLICASPVARFLNKKSLKGKHASSIRSIEDFKNMSWEDFEALTCELYSGLGYKSEVKGGSGGDGGIDVICKKGRKTVIVQCKHWQDNVGVSIIREMFGVMHAERASEVHIVTSTGFTPDALAFGDRQKRIKLIGPEDIIALIKQGKEYYKLL